MPEIPETVPEEIYTKFESPTPTENEIETKWLNFSIGDREFIIYLKPIKDIHQGVKTDSSPIQKKGVKLIIRTKDGDEYGEIFGIMKKNADGSGFEFSDPSVWNNYLDESGFRKTPQKLPGYVKGVIKESIKQLVLHGGISEWKSSETLLKGGTIMYETLMNDPSLKVSKEDIGLYEDGSVRFQYTIVKAPDSNIP